MGVGNRGQDAYRAADEEFVPPVARPVGVAADHTLHYREAHGLHDQVAPESSCRHLWPVERSQVEEALRTSQDGWRAVFENSAVGMALTDLTGRFLVANAAYQTMVGYTQGELQTCSFMDITHEDNREANRVLITELLEGKRQQFHIEKRYRRKNGHLIWVRNHVSLGLDAESRPRFIIAVVENITEGQRLAQELQHERDRLQLLLDLHNTMVSAPDLRHLFRAISASLRRVLHCDLAGLIVPDVANGQLRLDGLDSPDGEGILQEGMRIPVEGSASGMVFRAGKPLALNSFEQASRDPEIYGGKRAEDFYQLVAAEGIQSGCFLPIISRGRVLGVLALASLHKRVFTQDDVQFLGQIASQVAIAVENDRRRHATASHQRLAEAKPYLQEEIYTGHHFEAILGESAALKAVLRQVEIVAPMETMEALTRHRWPGNVRELQNVIERAVILSSGPVLHPPLVELKLKRPTASAPTQVGTLEEAERTHILQVLQEAKWVIAGPRGAAARLGVKRSTLYAKMAKLGIPRRSE